MILEERELLEVKRCGIWRNCLCVGYSICDLSTTARETSDNRPSGPCPAVRTQVQKVAFFSCAREMGPHCSTLELETTSPQHIFESWCATQRNHFVESQSSPTQTQPNNVAEILFYPVI